VALVEGRRPGFNEAIAFDEAAVDVEPGGVSWVCRKAGRTMAATEDVRGYAHEPGARSKTPSPGESARRSFGRCSTRTARSPRSGRHRGYGPAC